MLEQINLESYKFSALKEQLKLAKETNDKEYENYIRKIMTKKYIEYKKNMKKINSKNNQNDETDLTDTNKPLIKTINGTNMPPIPDNPVVVPYSKKKDKYTNILASHINLRNRLDSNHLILESIKNNNKTGFIKPYIS